MNRTKMVAWILILCLCLGACTAENPAGEGGSKPSATVSDQTVPTPPTRGPLDLGKTVKFELGGKLQVNHTVNISSARYIDGPDKLPVREELQKYDEAWFRDHALVLIYETVGNSSMDVGIESILLEEGEAQITLSHKPGKNPGTTRMTTWLIWVEVEQGLDYTWTVLNPAEDSDIAEY